MKLNYMTSRINTLLIVLLFTFTLSALSQQKQVADMVVAVVNNNYILKSDIDSLTGVFIKDYNRTFSQELWYQLLSAEIEKFILLEKAKIDSVVVSDDEVDRLLNQRIRAMVRQAGSEEVLEQYFGKSMLELRLDWRSVLRNDQIVNKVKTGKINSIEITRPEVIDFFESIPKDSIPVLPERIKLAQVVKIPKPNPNARKAAFDKAVALRDSILTHDKSIEELARRYSDGPSAKNGGYLPLIDISELVSEYSAAAAALQPGEISQVVETSYGFHVIRLNRRVGDQISTNHILIQVDKNDVDEESAIRFLESLKDSIDTGITFQTLARKHSEDKLTSNSGGVLRDPQTNDEYIQLTKLDPALYRIALLLDKIGDISEPKPFTTNPPNSKKAFRIVTLLDKIEEHEANLDQDYEMFMNYSLNTKQMNEFNRWMKGLHNQFYVDIRISIPDKFKPMFIALK